MPLLEQISALLGRPTPLRAGISQLAVRALRHVSESVPLEAGTRVQARRENDAPLKD
ncbi:MAG TPA: hypothetical protein VER11_25935 [Polyangiaceae bacterium]|nr:hypothetical protein [Polyangiaceae bacterium]